MPQDMPPVGGYGAVQYKRNLPAHGLFRPRNLILASAGLMVYGWYQLVVGVREMKYFYHFVLIVSKKPKRLMIFAQ
ncbi:hypothetical protein QC761_0082850 [Podospora bellae-mahoneyi]|uniref:NADH dehydrogenase [ubiquinone] 1 alpha subcomplex subunit 13 n=1 Tax=Podospora bellae-mahoneyi TaxID=2093777 RepID=A0ABR0FHN4_9PEZI|nr:hypothetical protein QC761_0082850 [Podospora bellae-mahoneyi]